MTKKNLVVKLSVFIILFVAIGILLYIIHYFTLRESDKMQYKIIEQNYIELVKNNKEELEYVVNKMHRWPHSSIFFGNSISSNDRDIDYELKINFEFYEYIKNLYEMEEFDSIHAEDNEVNFRLSNPPENCYGYLSYYKENTEVHSDFAVTIDEHWVLWITKNF